MCCVCRAYGGVALDGELRGGDAESGGGRCRNDAAALRLREVPIAAILVAGVLGVGLPLAGRMRRAIRTTRAAFMVAKALTAEVILAKVRSHAARRPAHTLQSLPPCR